MHSLFSLMPFFATFLLLNKLRLNHIKVEQKSKQKLHAYNSVNELESNLIISESGFSLNSNDLQMFLCSKWIYFRMHTKQFNLKFIQSFIFIQVKQENFKSSHIQLNLINSHYLYVCFNFYF